MASVQKFDQVKINSDYSKLNLKRISPSSTQNQLLISPNNSNQKLMATMGAGDQSF
jgi:hypothetical protein